MLKKIVIVLLFLVSIPCLVFFQQKIKPGVVITKDNYRKFFGWQGGALSLMPGLVQK